MGSRCPCRQRGGPQRSDGTIVNDALYMVGAICYDCWLDSLIPFWYEEAEKYRWDGILELSRATRQPQTQNQLLDARPMTIRDALRAQAARRKGERRPAVVLMTPHQLDQLGPEDVKGTW